MHIRPSKSVTTYAFVHTQHRRWTDGRTEGRTDRRTDGQKIGTISRCACIAYWRAKKAWHYSSTGFVVWRPTVLNFVSNIQHWDFTPLSRLVGWAYDLASHFCSILSHWPLVAFTFVICHINRKTSSRCVLVRYLVFKFKLFDTHYQIWRDNHFWRRYSF